MIRGAKAVALIINSLGGSPVQSALIGKRVCDLARKANVPVLACEDGGQRRLAGGKCGRDLCQCCLGGRVDRRCVSRFRF